MQAVANEKTELFERTPIPAAVAKLAVPTILSSLVMVLYNLADTYFVSMLNNPIENSAVTLAAPVLLAFNAVNNLFGIGSSSMMSRSLGSRDYETVARSSAFGFYCSLGAGLLFSLLCIVFQNPLLTLLGADDTTRAATNGYMLWTVYVGATPSILNVVLAYLVRAEGAAMHASIGTMSGCLLNVVLDPIFIMPWGLNMGAAGAGLATAISNVVACCYFFVLLLVRRGRTYVCLNPKKFTFQKQIVKSVCGVGVPAAIQNLLNVTGMTILNNFTSVYQAEAITAMGISQKLNTMPFYVALGFSQGIMPLVSYNYASGNGDRMKKAVVFSTKASLVLMILISAAYLIFPQFFIELFMRDNSTVVAYGARFLRGFGVSLPFLCVDFMAVAVFQALGMGKMALGFAILRKVVLEIPALFVLNYFFPLFGLTYSQGVAEVVTSIIAVIVLVRLFRRLGQKPEEKEPAEETVEAVTTAATKEDE